MWRNKEDLAIRALTDFTSPAFRLPRWLSPKASRRSTFGFGAPDRTYARLHLELRRCRRTGNLQALLHPLCHQSTTRGFVESRLAPSLSVFWIKSHVMDGQVQQLCKPYSEKSIQLHPYRPTDRLYVHPGCALLTLRNQFVICLNSDSCCFDNLSGGGLQRGWWSSKVVNPLFIPLGLKQLQYISVDSLMHDLCCFSSVVKTAMHAELARDYNSQRK
jgi:hypothetical protein